MDQRKAAALLLAYHRAFGASAVVSDEPVDWLARLDRAPLSPADILGAGGQSPPKLAPPSRISKRASSQPLADAAADLRAAANQRPPSQALAPAHGAAPAAIDDDGRERAANAANLAELRAALDGFEGCALQATAKNLCFFRGAEKSDLMIIGEGPGRDEDQTGIPFVGRAGKLLDKMLAAIARSEADVHITNVVYWRPPGNRTPTPAEVLACRPFLERQIELVNPRVIVAVGGAAAKCLLDTTSGIMKLRGKWTTLELAGTAREIMPTLHPAYLLRTPAAKRMAWRDLLAIQQRLEELQNN